MVRPLSVALVEPRIEIPPKFPQTPVDLSPESHPVELRERRLLETLADTIGLWLLHLGLGVVDVVESQVELILVAFHIAAELAPAVRENT